MRGIQCNFYPPALETVELRELPSFDIPFLAALLDVLLKTLLFQT